MLFKNKGLKLKRIKISYKELFERLNIDTEVSNETVYENKHNIKIKNTSESINIEGFIKKPKMKIIKLIFEDGLETKCAENHIFLDKQGEVFAKDAKEVQTIFGIKKVISKEFYSEDEVYDIGLPAPHLYTTTNGIIHHNTKLGDAFMKHLLETTDIKIINKKDEMTQELEDTVIDIITQESEGIKVAYVKNEDILSQDIFWNILRDDEYHLVFLDDLDYSLLPRTQTIATGMDVEKNKFVSHLLSFTDGIFESGNKTKFIITTNKEIGDIDTAVLRKGRTFDILELRELHNKEARDIWISNGLAENDFEEAMGQDKVLQADLGSTITMAKKAIEKNVELKPYVLEDGISMYMKTKNPKKLGL